MAETFGVVAGSIGVAALFSNCVQCFEYLQLGRNFGQDYERYQLKIDLTMTRLSRWGELVSVYDNPDLMNAGEVHRLLAQIQESIEVLYTKSKKYEVTNTPVDGSLAIDTSPPFQRLHGRLQEVTRKRQKGVGLLRKVSWALYDGKSLEKLLADLSDFVKSLEELYPGGSGANTLRELAMADVEDIEDQDLRLLRSAAEDVDSIMQEAANIGIQRCEGLNSALRLRQEDSARALVGNFISGDAIASGFRVHERTRNIADDAVVGKNARLQVGNSFGGKSGFWDN